MIESTPTGADDYIIGKFSHNIDDGNTIVLSNQASASFEMSFSYCRSDALADPNPPLHIFWYLIDRESTPNSAQLGDRVWADRNSNGVQEDDEPGIEGVNVKLLDGDGNIITPNNVTDASGNYLFNNLVAGKYIIEVDETTLPVDMVFTTQGEGGDEALDSDVDPDTGRTGIINLAPGESDLTVDAGLVVERTIEDDISIFRHVQLEALVDVVEITGNLFIDDTFEQIDFSPLDKLRRVGGSLVIINNNLTSISGFGALQSVGGDLVITNNRNLTSISGFSALQSVGGDLFITKNRNLTSISGFDSLTGTGIVGTSIIRNNASFNCTSPLPFSPVGESVGNGVDCRTRIIQGDVSIGSQAELDALVDVVEITGDLFIEFTSEQLDFSPLDKLRRVGGGLFITDNFNLTSILGFNALASVGGSLNISFNDELTSISGFGSLTRANIGIGINGGSSRIEDNPSLHCNINPQASLPFLPVDSSSGNGFDCPRIIQGDVSVSSQDAINNLAGVIEITGDLEIPISGQFNFSPLDNLRILGGNFNIFFNSGLTSISGFNALESVGGNFNIQLIFNLTSILGFNALESVGGNFNISDNDNLTSISGFDSLTGTGIVGTSSITRL